MEQIYNSSAKSQAEFTKWIYLIECVWEQILDFAATVDSFSPLNETSTSCGLGDRVFKQTKAYAGGRTNSW
jgi:hypothetical protein